MRTPLLFILSIILVVSCTTKPALHEQSDAIRLNQLGYYPSSPKQFVLADVEGESFKIVDTTGTLKFEGDLVKTDYWEASGENVMLGDFSDFSEEGVFSIVVDDKFQSYDFEIKKHLYEKALKATVKSFYFQRASMPIAAEYGGAYERAAGHLDDTCLMHPSTGYTEGTWNGSGGWYDAGDYGKYVVNASLASGQMLALQEMFPNVLSDGSLNIPESGNGVSDLLDEIKYELDWILKMQDKDGGVFFKLTAKKFSGFIMPEAYMLDRYIIGKGTASTLNLAAVMAQASRLYNVDADWSTNALLTAERAWDWAIQNPEVAFKNPEDVSTGEYGDAEFEDDFYWAATELYLTTKNEKYLDYLKENSIEIAHRLHDSWKYFIRNNAFHSILYNESDVPADFYNNIKEGQVGLADEILTEIENHPYRIGLNEFVWGSNSDILNQAQILCVAHKLTQDEKYLVGAEQIVDYILGKNATGYSFLTGFGNKLVKHPHHRPSEADAIPGAIPGFIIGGPNVHKQDGGNVEYHSEFSAKSFEDVVASFASNEVCLNWNAPAVFVFGYLEQVKN